MGLGVPCHWLSKFPGGRPYEYDDAPARDDCLRSAYGLLRSQSLSAWTAARQHFQAWWQSHRRKSEPFKMHLYLNMVSMITLTKPVTYPLLLDQCLSVLNHMLLEHKLHGAKQIETLPNKPRLALLKRLLQVEVRPHSMQFEQFVCAWWTTIAQPVRQTSLVNITHQHSSTDRHPLL